jgi:hypothetical protein
MYEDNEVAGVIVHDGTGDEVALDDSQLYPPGPYVVVDGDDVTA